MPLTLWRDVVDTPELSARVVIAPDGRIHITVGWYRGNGHVDRSWIATVPTEATSDQVRHLWAMIMELHLMVSSVQAIHHLRLLGRNWGWNW